MHQHFFLASSSWFQKEHSSSSCRDRSRTRGALVHYTTACQHPATVPSWLLWIYAKIILVISKHEVNIPEDKVYEAQDDISYWKVLHKSNFCSSSVQEQVWKMYRSKHKFKHEIFVETNTRRRASQSLLFGAGCSSWPHHALLVMLIPYVNIAIKGAWRVVCNPLRPLIEISNGSRKRLKHASRRIDWEYISQISFFK